MSALKTILRAGRNSSEKVYIPPEELTINHIRLQIPPEHFQQSLLKSSLYLARDLIQLAATYGAMVYYVLPLLQSYQEKMPHPALYSLLKFAVWNLFWFVQGLNFTAIWVMAHECGHQAFSPSQAINDAVGFVLHSALLVPYHSWRITHRNHHKHTNHLTKDTVFIPAKQKQEVDLPEEPPLWSVFYGFRMLLIGWPAYLIFNATGGEYPRRANHFEPSSPLFRPEDAQDVILSDIGIVLAGAVLAVATSWYGFLAVTCWYGMPYIWVNGWLIFITFMQHTDIRIPHYTNEHWTFPRGALATVDRDFGPILNVWLHHINDSHVVHHLFSTMPFYEAITVTRLYMRDILGDLYVTDKQSLLLAYWKVWRECVYVVPSEGICVFRLANSQSNKKTA